ncbi:hypothetical protein M514_10416 [Trichuris suis]|uniref:DUF19 domain-containing protein n=1 Tax=Trichuris suis TaxID=68888 RepID=A0A085NIJ7_9BILA|nr:hypothetical protein M513_10416 [Trichuris suis]KFD69293.1 hypothetical protein M514_10416 [Trichuris suis]
MVVHQLLVKIAFILLPIAYVKSQCGSDVVKYLDCVDEKYTTTLGLKIQDALKEAHETVSRCFAANSCQAPPLPRQRGAPQSHRTKRSTLVEPVKHGVLNDEYFPGANGKVFNEQMGICLQKKNGESKIVLQCLRRKLPEFEYPKSGLILLATDYVSGGTDGVSQQNMVYAGIADLSKQYLEISTTCTAEKASSVRKCISEAFGKRQSEPLGKVPEMGNMKAFWCKISSECLAKANAACAESIKHLGSYTCECLRTEKRSIIDRIAKDYEECIGLKPNISALDNELNHEISTACLSYEKSLKICG